MNFLIFRSWVLMSPNFLEKIIHLIEKKLGLKPNSVNHLTWNWALKERLARCHLSTAEEYYERLICSSYELQEFIELIVVPETWFFRDCGSYDFLNQHILSLKSISTCHLLSLACSSGEEPYSIAMALMAIETPDQTFTIDAVDISQKVLIKAKQGIYSKNSFRGKELDYRDLYFKKQKEEYVLHPFIKNQVHFYHGNVLDNSLPFEAHSYEVIFCRNLLIYLSARAQQQLFDFIKSLLVPQGILFVGPAESQLAAQAGFNPIHFPRAYAFVKAETEKIQLAESLPHLLDQKDYDQLMQDLKIHTRVSLKDETPLIALNIKEELIQGALKLADKGEFKKSAELCLNFIHHYGVNADIYYLLGLIEHAVGKENKAQEFFQKTVYLKPSHYEALVYLALLHEKKGEFNKAELFRKRAQKSLPV
jgi:chemotaxis protein methyltransferase WspC